MKFKKYIALLCGLSAFHASLAQSPWERLANRPATLGLEQGISEFDAAPFKLKLVKASQTAAGLGLLAEPAFDYTPDERLKQRAADKLYHLGDINLRLRKKGEAGWITYSTAARRKPVTALPVSGNALAIADLTATLPADIPLGITRIWEKAAGGMVLHFKLSNKTGQDVEIGGLGIPMIFNNILDGKKLDEAHTDNVFFDPYIGEDAGYLQVNRLNGKGGVLLVLPGEHTPFEAYNPLLNDPTPRGTTFEGFHEWVVYSKAYAETDWKGVAQWNSPTSAMLKPGESTDFSLRFVMAPSVREIEQALIEQKRPVAVGVPGYVLPEDEQAKLFLNYPKKIRSISASPAGALDILKEKNTPHGWNVYAIQGKTWGRARLTIEYEDGLRQTVQYNVISPETQTVNNLGHFLTTTQWYENNQDLFDRSPSVITYDYAEKKLVTQESRAWFAGLSDEAGAGSWLAAILKQSVTPDKAELDKLQRFLDHTLWGGIQYADGVKKYGVRKSMFYYEPDSMPAGTYSPDINYKTWAAWPKKEAENIGRSYNYPHVAAAHWVMYRLARYHTGLVTTPWKTSLERAYQTAIAMVQKAPYYAQFGQMEGSVFLYILQDLRHEGMNDLATNLEAVMKKRADHWRTLGYPFGSEMPWDSTGQEEVYTWSDYFGYRDKADVTLNAILAYMPAIPHWGYNGSARRYWDFVYGGKLSRIERQLHHYGSALNAIPVLAAYRRQPDDFYLLRIGYAGMMGALSNITKEGFGPAAFHSYPSTLAIDSISGDYGSGFYGYAVNNGTYIYKHPEFGWLAFGGNLSANGKKMTTEIRSAGASRIFLAPLGLSLSLDAGRFQSITYDEKSGEVTILLQPKDTSTPQAFLRIAQTGPAKGAYHVKGAEKNAQDAYTIALSAEKTLITLAP